MGHRDTEHELEQQRHSEWDEVIETMTGWLGMSRSERRRIGLRMPLARIEAGLAQVRAERYPTEAESSVIEA